MSDSIRLICNNPSCINKSFVYRRIDSLNEHRCKKCSWPLVVPKIAHYKLASKQNETAKRELERFSS